MAIFDEASYENSIIELFSNMGYTHIYGPDVERDIRNPLMEEQLRNSIEMINPELPQNAVDETVYKIKTYEAASLVSKNEIFMDYLQNGIQISYMKNGENKSELVRLVDYNTPSMNSFVVANQWTYSEYETKRPDVVIFLNGIPVVVMELKSPKADTVTIEDAYQQIQNYKKSIEGMFIYNAFCVISDQSQTKAGTITASIDRFMDWKTVDGDYEETRYADFTTLIKGMFTKNRFLDIIQNFICFSKEIGGDVKILAAYHQYFAVKKAVESTKKASAEGGDGRGGVFWHTQGSGKSLSMVFYAKYIQSVLNSPTIVVITDRNDLDDQLFAQFSKCKDFLRQTPVQAEKRRLSDEEKKNGSKTIALMDWLDGRTANGIIFTTMQKFEEGGETLSTRKNIVVMADEAHRGHYGLVPKVSTRTNEHGELETKTTVGMAKIIRDSLPNASFIGFTGTPISDRDRDTREIFGNYIDIYDMTQAVEDGATRPVYYESRVIQLKLDDKVLKLLDDEYDHMAQNADPYAIEKSKRDLGKMEAILGADKTIDSLVRDILDHYENYRANLLTGKAMIVAYTRGIAIKIYRKLLELRPDWTKKIGIVMTQGNSDPEDWRTLIGNKSHKEEMARQFKDSASSLKIAIVVDMWLTGFDVPSLATMYVYKPMKGHNLMQAIARVNRVYRDKEAGLIVDYIGMAAELKSALSQYTKRDQDKIPDLGQALSIAIEKLEIMRDMFYGFDYSDFFGQDDSVRLVTIANGVNFALGMEEDEQKSFIREATALSQAETLCRSMLDARIKQEIEFFKCVKAGICKTAGRMGITTNEINARIMKLLEQAIEQDGVYNIFAEAGKKNPEISILSEEYMEKIRRMKHKNIAAEMLRKLLEDNIRVFARTGVVKSLLFSEKMQKLLKMYNNRLITSAEVIEELLNLSKEMTEAYKAGDEKGLSVEELAFYDALVADPEVLRKMQDKVLIEMICYG